MVIRSVAILAILLGRIVVLVVIRVVSVRAIRVVIRVVSIVAIIVVIRMCITIGLITMVIMVMVVEPLFRVNMRWYHYRFFLMLWLLLL